MSDKKKIIYVELNTEVPLHQEALSFLQEYQRRTGLSKKDTLVQVLIVAKKAAAAEILEESKTPVKEIDKRMQRLMNGDY